MRVSEEEEHPDTKTIITVDPPNQQPQAPGHNWKGDVSEDKMTSKCHHRPSKSPDLVFTQKDLPRYSRSSMKTS
jgi:hypothetical protein